MVTPDELVEQQDYEDILLDIREEVSSPHYDAKRRVRLKRCGSIAVREVWTC